MIPVRTRRSLRRGRSSLGSLVVRGIALLAALAVAYGGGVVTGVIGTTAHDEQARLAPASWGQHQVRTTSRPAGGVDDSAVTRLAVRYLLRENRDRWAVYYSPSEYSTFRQALEGRYSGVGLWLRDGRPAPVVSTVVDGSPAEGAGLRVGDVVVAVDGASVLHTAASSAAALLRGREGSPVSVIVRRDGVVRAATMRRVRMRADDVRVERLPGRVLHVQVLAFTRGVARQVGAAVAARGAAAGNGVVLDVRGNPGGLVAEAVGVASVFLDSGPVATYERRGRKERILRASDDGDTRTPLVVLVDAGTASAAELLAAALQDRSRAVVVGSRTVGKGVVQRPERLSDGSGVTVTVGRYLTPSGDSVEGRGVEPDVEVPTGTPASVGERRAVKVLSGLSAAMTSNGRG